MIFSLRFRGTSAGDGDLLRLEIDFDGDTQQVFQTGPAAVAVPGTALGLEAAHRSFGSLPWAELVAPAARLAREGVELTPAQGYLHRILDGLLRHSPEGDAMYRGADGPLRAGDRFFLPDFADTLDRIAAEGAAALYGGELARRIVEHVQAGGGGLTLDDLAGYEVIRREPLAVEYRGHEFRTNPPPSSGGALIALGLRTLGDAAPDAEAVVAAMEAQEAARGGGLLSGTTHISVVDARGDAASLSASLGSGSGVVVPGTGIHLNNMLGEADLAGDAKPGERLTSMMAPSVVLRDGRPRLVVGSAGSARLRGAILQVVANVVGARDGRRGGGRRAAAARGRRRRLLRGRRRGRPARGGGPRGRALQAAEPLLRRRERGRGAAPTEASRPPATRGAAARAWWSREPEFVVRRAEPGDAEGLTHLAEAVSGEPEAWLISADGEWRSSATSAAT